LVATNSTGVRVDNNKEWTLVSPKKHTDKSNKRNKGETVPKGHLITLQKINKNWNTLL
jgi:hypothetical protein